MTAAEEHRRTVIAQAKRQYAQAFAVPWKDRLY